MTTMTEKRGFYNFRRSKKVVEIVLMDSQKNKKTQFRKGRESIVMIVMDRTSSCNTLNYLKISMTILHDDTFKGSS